MSIRPLTPPCVPFGTRRFNHIECIDLYASDIPLYPLRASLSLDERRIEKLLSNPWTADDKTFSARIWKDRTQLVDTIEKELTRMVATGETPDKTIKAISDRLNVSKSNAGRLVMTESAYFASEAQREC